MHQQDQQELREGDLYVVRDGELRLIEPDPTDTTMRVRITQDAYAALKRARDTITRATHHRPDLSVVASALVEMHSGAPDLLSVMQRYHLQQVQRHQAAGRKPGPNPGAAAQGQS